MTPRQADKLIAGKTPVNVFTTDGGTYDRGELEVVAPAATEGGR